MRRRNLAECLSGAGVRIPEDGDADPRPEPGDGAAGIHGRFTGEDASGVAVSGFASPNTTAVNIKMSVSSSFHAEGGNPALRRGLFEESLAVPSLLDRHLRQQNSFMIAFLHEQAMLANPDLLDVGHAPQGRKD